ncbi:MAG: pyruvate dehydrogenase complex dihydrolipoamide acetyltransferase [Pseudomonadota bacterium]
MPINILMPALSPTMEEGKLAKWLKAEGDTVTSGDLIAEIETDKATMEVEAVDEGVLGKILIPEGTDAVKVNEVIALLLEEGEDAAELQTAPAASKALAPVEDAPAPTIQDPPKAATPAPMQQNGARVFASPLARRIAAEKGLDLARITGSGPRGRIVKADVLSAEAAPSAHAPATAVPPPAAMRTGPDAASVQALYEGRSFEEIPLDGMRKTIAARLTEAKQTIPHFYLRRDIELDALLALRKQLNVSGEARGVKLSVNDFIIKACALALQDVPDCNAVWASDRLLRFAASDVAVAVAIEGGLFTPVIRDAEGLSLSAISAAMKDLAGRAREKKLAPQEYQGGSFAISNLGMFGVENFDAVINPPHGSILAVGAGVQKPVVKDGALATATVMSVTLSCDHRVIDGALGARFLDAIKRGLEDPLSMLM